MNYVLSFFGVLWVFLIDCCVGIFVCDVGWGVFDF